MIIKSYRGFGTALCSELDTAVAALGSLLKEAAAKGFKGPQIEAAKSFYAIESSMWRGTSIAWGETCRNLVATANGHIANLEKAFKAVGVEVNVPKPEIEKAAGAGEYISAIKFVGFAVGALAVAYFAGPLVREGVAMLSARRTKARA